MCVWVRSVGTVIGRCSAIPKSRNPTESDIDESDKSTLMHFTASELRQRAYLGLFELRPTAVVACRSRLQQANLLTSA